MIIGVAFAMLVKFQFTHPRGVRPAVNTFLPILRKVSIHAPAWGATSERSNVGQVADSFNSRTRVGCDARQES